MSTSDNTFNPFVLLGQPQTFALDLEAMESAYLEANAKTHPDRFTDPMEQADAAERTSRINEAYRVLRDPQLRAKTLLALFGEQDAAEIDSDEATLPPDFLMEMMETRETMEAAIAQNDSQQLQSLLNWAKDARQAHLNEIASLFDAGIDHERATQIQTALHKLRYIDRMIEQMPTQ